VYGCLSVLFRCVDLFLCCDERVQLLLRFRYQARRDLEIEQLREQVLFRGHGLQNAVFGSAAACGRHQPCGDWSMHACMQMCVRACECSCLCVCVSACQTAAVAASLAQHEARNQAQAAADASALEAEAAACRRERTAREEAERQVQMQVQAATAELSQQLLHSAQVRASLRCCACSQRNAAHRCFCHSVWYSCCHTVSTGVIAT
jgi:hypothetical protein